MDPGTVIGRISRAGDVGEPGYSAWGQTLPACTYSGSQDDWHGATQDNLSALLPTCYITESVYTFLTDDEIESVRGRILGIVPDAYAHQVKECPDSGKCYYCWRFLPDVEARPLPLPDPCEGIPCPDDCIDYDLYSWKCVEGECVPDQLIEENSAACDYMPPDREPKPECTEGDKKPGHVCVAGKWKEVTVAEPVVEPVPEPVPPADGMFTIEFQELISGVKPPRVPLLVPGLETLPLLPGWIVRDAAGNIVNEGMRLPTL